MRVSSAVSSVRLGANRSACRFLSLFLQQRLFGLVIGV